MKIPNMSGLTGILFLLVTFSLMAESIGKSAGESSAANFESLPSSIGKLTAAGVGCTAVAIRQAHGCWGWLYGCRDQSRSGGHGCPLRVQSQDQPFSAARLVALSAGTARRL